MTMLNAEGGGGQMVHGDVDTHRPFAFVQVWLEVHAPKLHRALAPGADRMSLMRLERGLGLGLPGPVADSLLRHDGQDGMGWPVLGMWELLDCERMRLVWSDRTPLDGGHNSRIHCHGPVRQQVYARGWIPVGLSTCRVTPSSMMMIWPTRAL